MKLPNHEQAHVSSEKIIEYLLNTQHPEGRGKARFFHLYGFTVAQWTRLADALLAHAQIHEVTKIEQTAFGVRYVIEGELETPIRRRPRVRVVWFIESNSSMPRLVTAYPLEAENDQRI